MLLKLVCCLFSHCFWSSCTLSILYLGYRVKYFIHSVALHITLFECTNVFCVNNTFCGISEVWNALLIVTAEDSLTAAEYQKSCWIVLVNFLYCRITYRLGSMLNYICFFDVLKLKLLIICYFAGSHSHPFVCIWMCISAWFCVKQPIVSVLGVSCVWDTEGRFLQCGSWTVTPHGFCSRMNSTCESLSLNSWPFFSLAFSKTYWRKE